MSKFLYGEFKDVKWKELRFSNVARPRAMFSLCLTCLDPLLTKEKLIRFGTMHDKKCIWCDKDETIQHLFVECSQICILWSYVGYMFSTPLLVVGIMSCLGGFKWRENAFEEKGCFSRDDCSNQELIAVKSVWFPHW